MDEKITAVLRVTGCTIDDRGSLTARQAASIPGEVVEMKASGYWVPEYTQGAPKYPASLHITVYPGCGAIPVVGDHIKVTVERA